MTPKSFNRIILSMILFVFISSCEKNTEEKSEQSEGLKKFLEVKTRMNAFNAGPGQMGDFMSVIAESQLKNGSMEIEGLNIDSSYIDIYYCDTCEYPDIWDWKSCAVITETDNQDGTHTTVYDYGEGCEEYGALVKGKITYIWSSEGSNYYSRVIYENYYSFGIEMNGYSEYTFTSDGNSWFALDAPTGANVLEGDTTLILPEYKFFWSGTSTCKDDYTVVADNGESYSYASDYSTAWDSLSYTVKVGYYHMVNESLEFEYTYEVTSPLVTSFECTDTWVPVSGIESTVYTEAGIVSTFKVDYGNGTCDNLATVSENGKTSEVDFSELWQVVSDGTVVSNSVPGNSGRGK
jgi:hypothetical protein